MDLPSPVFVTRYFGRFYVYTYTTGLDEYWLTRGQERRWWALAKPAFRVFKTLEECKQFLDEGAYHIQVSGSQHPLQGSWEH